MSQNYQNYQQNYPPPDRNPSPMMNQNPRSNQQNQNYYVQNNHPNQQQQMQMHQQMMMQQQQQQQQQQQHQNQNQHLQHLQQSQQVSNQQQLQQQNQPMNQPNHAMQQNQQTKQPGGPDWHLVNPGLNQHPNQESYQVQNGQPARPSSAQNQPIHQPETYPTHERPNSAQGMPNVPRVQPREPAKNRSNTSNGGIIRRSIKQLEGMTDAYRMVVKDQIREAIRNLPDIPRRYEEFEDIIYEKANSKSDYDKFAKALIDKFKNTARNHAALISQRNSAANGNRENSGQNSNAGKLQNPNNASQEMDTSSYSTNNNDASKSNIHTTTQNMNINSGSTQNSTISTTQNNNLNTINGSHVRHEAKNIKMENTSSNTSNMLNSNVNSANIHGQNGSMSSGGGSGNGMSEGNMASSQNSLVDMKEYKEELAKCSLFLPKLNKILKDLETKREEIKNSNGGKIDPNDRSLKKSTYAKIANLRDQIQHGHEKMVPLEQLKAMRISLQDWQSKHLQNNEAMLKMHEKMMQYEQYRIKYREYLLNAIPRENCFTVFNQEGIMQKSTEQAQYAHMITNLSNPITEHYTSETTKKYAQPMMRSIYTLSKRSPNFTSLCNKIFQLPLNMLHKNDHYIDQDNVYGTQNQEVLKVANQELIHNLCSGCGLKKDRKLLQETMEHEELNGKKSPYFQPNQPTKRKLIDTNHEILDQYHKKQKSEVKSKFCICHKKYDKFYTGLPNLPEILIGEVMKLDQKFEVDMDKNCLFTEADKIDCYATLLEKEKNMELILLCSVTMPGSQPISLSNFYGQSQQMTYSRPMSLSQKLALLPKLYLKLNLNYPDNCAMVDFDKWDAEFLLNFFETSVKNSGYRQNFEHYENICSNIILDLERRIKNGNYRTVTQILHLYDLSIKQFLRRL